MPARERVRVVHDSTLPVARVFAFLAEHENLGKIFAPARITRLRDGRDGTRNGVGSARVLRVGLMPPVEETTTDVVPDERIEYAITRGGPLTEHWARIHFEPRGAGTRITWTIGLKAPIPGLATLTARALKTAIARGLRKVDALA